MFLLALLRIDVDPVYIPSCASLPIFMACKGIYLPLLASFPCDIHDLPVTTCVLALPICGRQTGLSPPRRRQVTSDTFKIPPKGRLCDFSRLRLLRCCVRFSADGDWTCPRRSVPAISKMWYPLRPVWSLIYRDRHLA